jgi:hypothetical protein
MGSAPLRYNPAISCVLKRTWLLLLLQLLLLRWLPLLLRLLLLLWLLLLLRWLSLLLRLLHQLLLYTEKIQPIPVRPSN